MTLVAGAIAGLSLLAGCGEDSEPTPSKPSTPPKQASTTPPSPPPPPAEPEPPKPVEPVVDTRTPEELVEAGRGVYLGNCIACHNLNPAEDGALGPAVAGSSLALIEARVIHGNYPEGYEPKRPSRVMVALPHLEPKVPELTAYLQSLN